MKLNHKHFRVATVALLLGAAIGIGAQSNAHAAPAPALPLPTKLPANFVLPGGVLCKTETNIVGRAYAVTCGSGSVLGLAVLPAPGDAALPPGVLGAGGVDSEPIKIRCNLDSQTCSGGGDVFVRLPSNTPPAMAAQGKETGYLRYVLDCRTPLVHGALDCDVSILETAH